MRTFRTPAVLVLVLTGAAYVRGQKLPSDDSTFMVAVTRGDVALVRQMLDDERADTNGTNGAGYSWIYMAAEHGHKAVLELLISRGANVHTQGDGKNATVYIAAKRGNADIVDSF